MVEGATKCQLEKGTQNRGVSTCFYIGTGETAGMFCFVL